MYKAWRLRGFVQTSVPQARSINVRTVTLLRVCQVAQITHSIKKCKSPGLTHFLKRASRLMVGIDRERNREDLYCYVSLEPRLQMHHWWSHSWLWEGARRKVHRKHVIRVMCIVGKGRSEGEGGEEESWAGRSGKAHLNLRTTVVRLLRVFWRTGIDIWWTPASLKIGCTKSPERQALCMTLKR